MKRAIIHWLCFVLVPLVAVGCYEMGGLIIWVGGPTVPITVIATHPVREIRETGGISTLEDAEAVYRRDEGAEGMDWYREPLRRTVSGGFEFWVKAVGRQSPLRIWSDTYVYQKYHVFQIELDNGERWLTMVTLPDDLRTNRDYAVTFTIPDNARQIANASAKRRGP